MFQPTKEWVNKVNLSSFEHENFFKFSACVISARKAKQLDATTMFTYSHANTALGQSERAYYLSYFIKINRIRTKKVLGLFPLCCYGKVSWKNRILVSFKRPAPVKVACTGSGNAQELIKNLFIPHSCSFNFK